MNPKALILTGYGINCEEETAFCFNQAGATAQIVHINDLIAGDYKLSDFQIMAFPGGFSYGDDTGSGNAMANKIYNNIRDQILDFAKSDKLIIGICNGFQMITNLGLVPAIDEKYGERQAALMHNKQARYECRWVNVKTQSQKCIWLKDIDRMPIPIAHGEGNFYCEPQTLETLKQNDQIALRYCDIDGNLANGVYPINPNGAMDDIAGVCDPSGRILGLMPHPERYNHFTNLHNWQMEKERLLREGKDLPEEGLGLKMFKNAVSYFA